MTQPAQQRSLYPWLMKDYLALASDYSKNRLHHALLICGTAGLGKHQLVERFSQLIQCQQPIDNKACGQCQDCQLHHSKTHPDFYHVTKEEGKAQISIEKIRLLSKKIIATGLVNQRRVVVIEPLNSLTESAANALLKILEEPPKHVYFLLSTPSNQHIPATIMSRCFKLSVSMPPPTRVLAWLEKKTGNTITPSQLDLLGATPLRALSAIESGFYQALEQVINTLNDLYLAWSNKDINQAFSATLALNEQIEKLMANTTMSTDIDELLSIIQRFNQQVLKCQLSQHRLSSSLNQVSQASLLVNNSLIGNTHKIPPTLLLNFSSRLATLKRLLSNNNGLNASMQLQRSINQTTQEITDNEG
jgi:DNA polymerase III delta' subunit